MSHICLCFCCWNREIAKLMAWKTVQVSQIVRSQRKKKYGLCFVWAISMYLHYSQQNRFLLHFSLQNPWDFFLTSLKAMQRIGIPEHGKMWSKWSSGLTTEGKNPNKSYIQIHGGLLKNSLSFHPSSFHPWKQILSKSSNDPHGHFQLFLPPMTLHTQLSPK